MEENGETAFILTQDIIDSFKKSVGTAVYVRENGFGGQNGVGSVIAPVQTLSQVFAVLGGERGSIIADGYIAVAEEEILADNQSVTVQGAGSGGTLVNESGRVITDSNADNGGGVYIDGGTFTIRKKKKLASACAHTQNIPAVNCRFSAARAECSANARAGDAVSSIFKYRFLLYN